MEKFTETPQWMDIILKSTFFSISVQYSRAEVSGRFFFVQIRSRPYAWGPCATSDYPDVQGTGLPRNFRFYDKVLL